MKHKHIVLCDDPHIQSPAALILLNDSLRRKAKKYVKPKWRIWLTFRNRFLTRERRKGPLLCFYCGKGPLYKNSMITPKNYLATIDHVYPRSKGGGEYDESNLVVACFFCNMKKKDKILEDRTGTDGCLRRW